MTGKPNKQEFFRQPLQSRSAETLERVLQAADDIACSSGVGALTIASVAKRAGISVGTVYRRFEDKDQLISALTARMLEQRQSFMADRLMRAEPSLQGVLRAYSHALMDSFADTSRLFPNLLTIREADTGNYAAHTIVTIQKMLINSIRPYAEQIRRSSPDAALETVATALLSASFHSFLRPSELSGSSQPIDYADKISDMAIAYLLTPDGLA